MEDIDGIEHDYHQAVMEGDDEEAMRLLAKLTEGHTESNPNPSTLKRVSTPEASRRIET